MRIISGKYRGKRIVAPAKLPVRPTTDRAKESIFNILMNYYELSEISVLDLFSGTGNISYEFASRGSSDVTSVDENPACVKFISETVENIGFEGFQVVRTDAVKFLMSSHRKWDVIFADPPYDFENYKDLIDLVFQKSLLTEGGVFVLEHGREVNFEDHDHLLDYRKYGSVNFSIFGIE